jgi:hypothetical protein
VDDRCLDRAVRKGCRFTFKDLLIPEEDLNWGHYIPRRSVTERQMSNGNGVHSIGNEGMEFWRRKIHAV